MESLTENRPLLYSLFGSMAFMFALVLDVTPEINDQFEIVHFTEEVSYNVFKSYILVAVFDRLSGLFFVVTTYFL